MTNRNIVAPVFYHARENRRLRRHVGLTTIALKEVDEASAPLAARWWAPGEAAEQAQYRSHDGHVFLRLPNRERSGEPNLTMLTCAQDDPAVYLRVMRGQGLDETVGGVKLSWTNSYDHPLKPDEPSNGPGGSVFDIAIDAPFASSDPEFQRRAALVQARADRLIVLDGEVWQRCIGPSFTLQTGAMTNGAVPNIRWEQSRSSLGSDVSRRFLATEYEEASELARRWWPDLQVGANTVEILDRDAFRYPMGTVAYASTVWHALIATRMHKSGESSREHLGAAVELREAFEAMFPGREWNWFPSSFERQWCRNAEDIVDPIDVTPLIEPFQRIRRTWPLGPMARDSEMLFELLTQRAITELARSVQPPAPDQDEAALEELRL